MAALLLGCGALLSDRLKQRHRFRKENEKEYAARFEEFKAENERCESLRKRGTQDGSHSTPVVDTNNPARGTAGAIPMERPPSYDVATGREHC